MVESNFDGEDEILISCTIVPCWVVCKTDASRRSPESRMTDVRKTDTTSRKNRVLACSSFQFHRKRLIFV